MKSDLNCFFKWRSRILCMMSAIYIALGCSQESATSPFRAKIITSTESGYTFKTVSYKTLNSADAMDGDLAVLKGNAALNLESDVSEIVKSSDPDALYSKPGQTVELDYYLEDGIIVPRNFDSMAMLAIYYHYESTFLYWKENLGLTLAEFGKIRLFLNPTIEINTDEATISGQIKVNAAFLAGPRDFWFFKTSPLEEIPINMNFGVLAHEFSHGVFDLVFAGKDPSFYDTESKDNEEILQSINEGLADYFSWMVTNRLGEFRASLEALAKERTLPVAWTLKDLEDNKDGKICQSNFYCAGSVLASALYEIAATDSETALSVGQAAYASLRSFRDEWELLKNEKSFHFHILINKIYENLEGDKAASCQIFKKWFDQSTVLGGIAC